MLERICGRKLRRPKNLRALVGDQGLRGDWLRALLRALHRSEDRCRVPDPCHWRVAHLSPRQRLLKQLQQSAAVGLG